MLEGKVECNQCSAKILPETKSKNGGFCAVCFRRNYQRINLNEFISNAKLNGIVLKPPTIG